jgi:hypothetical protein
MGKIADPVLPDQAGRVMRSDPGYVIPLSEEDIRQLAYLIYESRGRQDGNALDDWLAAESSCRSVP